MTVKVGYFRYELTEQQAEQTGTEPGVFYGLWVDAGPLPAETVEGIQHAFVTAAGDATDRDAVAQAAHDIASELKDGDHPVEYVAFVGDMSYEPAPGVPVG